jgi:hypothetical protein
VLLLPPLGNESSEFNFAYKFYDSLFSGVRGETYQIVPSVEAVIHP